MSLISIVIELKLWSRTLLECNKIDWDFFLCNFYQFSYDFVIISYQKNLLIFILCRRMKVVEIFNCHLIFVNAPAQMRAPLAVSVRFHRCCSTTTGTISQLNLSTMTWATLSMDRTRFSRNSLDHLPMSLRSRVTFLISSKGQYAYKLVSHTNHQHVRAW